MTLRLVGSTDDPGDDSRRSDAATSKEPRTTTADASIGGAPPARLAPMAPASPGTLPFELATELRTGEALVWWGEKQQISWRPVAWTFGAAVLLLLVVTAFAPGFWSQPWSDVGKPVAAILSPVALVLAREFASRRSVMVTDSSVVVVTASGRADRLGFRNVRRVRKDWLTGGIKLDGAQHVVRVPPALLDPTRQAIASQTTGRIRADALEVDDPLQWMP